MKCILFSVLSHFSLKSVSYEDGICFNFSNICLNSLYNTNTASLNKMLTMVNYLAFLTIRYETKHVCLRYLGETLNSKCKYVFKKNKLYVSAKGLSRQTIVYINPYFGSFKLPFTLRN